jgi:hypothetical protein
MVQEEVWHRRHAIHIAAQLPEKPEDALIVLRAATPSPQSSIATTSS